MAFLSREFIAVPDGKKGQILYKHPDHEIRKFTKAIVNADEVALFVNKGRVAAQLGPGQHPIDADEIPGLGVLIDIATGGNAYKAELYFVSTREFTGERFGGRIDDVQDPQTGLVVTLRVFGEYAMRVADPVKVVTNLVGTVDVTDNTTITNWIDAQLLKAMKTDLTRNIVRNGWPVLGLSAFIPEIESAAISGANAQLESYGLALVRMGNLDVNLVEEDEKALKALAKDTTYSRLAGSYQGMAQAEMMRGAGAGMAQGGGAVGPAFIATGMAMGQAASQPVAAGPTPPPTPGFAGGTAGYAATAPTPAGAPCPACSVVQAPGARFCASCGAAQPAGTTCSGCGQVVAAGAKFCANCGTPTAPKTAHCTECGTELAPGAKFCANCGTPTVPGSPPPGGALPPPPPAGA